MAPLIPIASAAISYLAPTVAAEIGLTGFVSSFGGTLAASVAAPALVNAAGQTILAGGAHVAGVEGYENVNLLETAAYGGLTGGLTGGINYAFSPTAGGAPGLNPVGGTNLNPLGNPGPVAPPGAHNGLTPAIGSPNLGTTGPSFAPNAASGGVTPLADVSNGLFGGAINPDILRNILTESTVRAGTSLLIPRKGASVQELQAIERINAASEEDRRRLLQAADKHFQAADNYNPFYYGQQSANRTAQAQNTVIEQNRRDAALQGGRQGGLSQSQARRARLQGVRNVSSSFDQGYQAGQALQSGELDRGYRALTAAGQGYNQTQAGLANYHARQRDIENQRIDKARTNSVEFFGHHLGGFSGSSASQQQKLDDLRKGRGGIYDG